MGVNSRPGIIFDMSCLKSLSDIGCSPQQSSETRGFWLTLKAMTLNSVIDEKIEYHLTKKEKDLNRKKQAEAQTWYSGSFVPCLLYHMPHISSNQCA